jgi:hypothetical protein
LIRLFPTYPLTGTVQDIDRCGGKTMSNETIPEFVDKLRIHALTDALFVVNKAIDKEAAEAVTVDEVHRHIDAGDLVRFLESKLGVAFSGVREGIDENRLFIEALRHVRQTSGRERKVYGVQNSGACLVIAYITEILQQGYLDLNSLTLYGQP